MAKGVELSMKGRFQGTQAFRTRGSARQGDGKRPGLWSSTANDVVYTAEVPQKAGRIAAAPRTENAGQKLTVSALGRHMA
jgi:hypothetical protein